MRTAVVLDTNVAIASNGKTDQAGPACVDKCIKRLRRVRADEKVVLDDGGQILEEYRRRLSPSGQPGPGDAFFKWLWTQQGNPGLCQKVAVTPDDEWEFEEFPHDDELLGFDRRDRKFVAVAMASGQSPPIVNATDTDWRSYRTALERFGIHIEFLCPELMSAR